MIELEQLKQLITFHEMNTLSAAADKLHISQPVLTRTMKKLEEELEVSLFTRTKNSIKFNDTGELAIKLAKRILDDVDDFSSSLKEYERKLHTIFIGSCAPAPRLELMNKTSSLYRDKTISSEIKDMNYLIKELKDKTYDLIIMPYPSNEENINSIEFMDETLFFSLPLNHKYKDKKTLSMKDMDGEKMLLMSDIGFWHDIHKRMMPNTKFLIQTDRQEFFDLVELSNMASFITDYTMNHENAPTNRVIIPISDKEAKAKFYCWYLSDNNNIKSLINQLL